MIFLNLLSRLPFPILYLLSNALYFIAYKLIGYRKKVVYKNLRNSFPDKTEKEIQQIAKNFYQNLADIAIEILKAKTISPANLLKRVEPENMQIVQDLHNNGVSFIAMVPHLCNWEWIGLACSLYLNEETDVIYQKLANKKFDQFMFDLRSRFGALPIEKKKVLRELIKRKESVKAIGSVSDQTPVVGENRYWTTFLNQDTAFFHGSEKIAKKLNYAICTIHMYRIKRGYYRMKFILLDAPPLNSEENHYTQKFAQWLETTIKQHPADWLWSHNRWKLKNVPATR